MFVEVKKRQDGDVVVSVQPQVLSQWVSSTTRQVIITFLYAFLRLVSWLNGYAYLMVMGVGLGLGLSMSMVVFQQPNTTQATPQIIRQKVGIAPERITLADSKISWPVHSQESVALFDWWLSSKAIYETNSAQLSEVGPVLLYVGGRHGLSEELHNVNLGDQIIALGENQGRYRYTVIETKQLARDDIATLYQQNSETIVLITPQNMITENVLAVMAR